MIDRIDELEQQANVILEWCRQQRLPEEQRDIFELRPLNGADWEWEPYIENHGYPNFHRFRYRLCKRPRKHKATLYWYRDKFGVCWCTSIERNRPNIGTSTTEFTEPQG